MIPLLARRTKTRADRLRPGPRKEVDDIQVCVGPSSNVQRVGPVRRIFVQGPRSRGEEKLEMNSTERCRCAATWRGKSPSSVLSDGAPRYLWNENLDNLRRRSFQRTAQCNGKVAACRPSLSLHLSTRHRTTATVAANTTAWCNGSCPWSSFPSSAGFHHLSARIRTSPTGVRRTAKCSGRSRSFLRCLSIGRPSGPCRRGNGPAPTWPADRKVQRELAQRLRPFAWWRSLP
jgi:hypothetical protein